MSSKKKVIFVGSTSRSGSTIFDMMLGNGEDCFSLGEVNAHFRPYRKHHLKSLCACGDTFCEVRDSFRRLKEQELYDHVFNNLGATVIIDSSKELTWIIDQYRRLSKRNDVDVSILLIYKDPVSLAHSYFKRGDSVLKFMKQYEYYGQFAQTGLPFTSVEYGALTRDPSGVLASICEFLGIAYFDGKEEYWNKEMHHFFGSHSVIQTYESDKPEIRAAEKYRDDFIPLIPSVNEALQKNTSLGKIVSLLEQHRLTGDGMTNGAKRKNKIHKPFWYYKRKLKAMYRKRFPQDYQDVLVSS